MEDEKKCRVGGMYAECRKHLVGGGGSVRVFLLTLESAKERTLETF